jgi:hypothetical protein
VIIPGFGNMLEEGWQAAAPVLAQRQKPPSSRC